jgi:hypothetical protein
MLVKDLFSLKSSLYVNKVPLTYFWVGNGNSVFPFKESKSIIVLGVNKMEAKASFTRFLFSLFVDGQAAKANYKECCQGIPAIVLPKNI